jgi:hypothetical protein
MKFTGIRSFAFIPEFEQFWGMNQTVSLCKARLKPGHGEVTKENATLYEAFGKTSQLAFSPGTSILHTHQYPNTP